MCYPSHNGGGKEGKKNFISYVIEKGKLILLSSLGPVKKKKRKREGEDLHVIGAGTFPAERKRRGESVSCLQSLRSDPSFC